MRIATVTLAVLVFAPVLSVRGAESSSASAPTAGSEPSALEIDPFMGEYVGVYQAGRTPAIGAEATVFPTGKGGYDITLTIIPPERSKDKPRELRLAGRRAGDKLRVHGGAASKGWSGELEGGLLTVRSAGVNGPLVELIRMDRTSPTEGAKPPAGAVVLLAQGAGPPSLSEWTNPRWRALPGGVMEIAQGDNQTKRSFGGFRMHLEFMTPYEPDARGQQRGNSGVYIQGRYEVQVLDSFGLKAGQGDCGAIYGVAPPKVNASLPPLRWQTYDIEFRAARMDARGKLTHTPVITVVHNGVKIHDKVKLPGPTGGASGKTHMPEGPIRIQDHHHPVRYRNIWLVELPETP